jgi:hypothetical protein
MAKLTRLILQENQRQLIALSEKKRTPDSREPAHYGQRTLMKKERSDHGLARARAPFRGHFPSTKFALLKVNNTLEIVPELPCVLFGP